MKRKLKFFACAVMLCLGFVGCGDETFSAAFPDIEVPESLLFPSTQLGQTEERPLVIQNIGGADLVIVEFSFTNETDTGEFSREDVALPLTIPPGEQFSLGVRYTPNDVGDDRGGLRIRNNSRQQDVVVTLITAGATSDLVATPARVELLSEDGGRVTKPVRLTNQGNVPIRILSLEMSEDSDENLTISVRPDLSAPLNTSDSLEVELAYTPNIAGGSAATLEVRFEYVVESDEAPREEQLLPVPVFGRRPAAQIAVSPESIVFGAIDEGTESDPMALVISNIGVRPLEISRIAFSLLDDEDNDQFELRNVPDTSNGPAIIEPGEQISLSVVYIPNEPASHSATLQIRSNSVEDGTKLVSVTGRVRRPCIEVIPSEIDLGIVALNIESLHSNAQITNCGDLPVDISEIQIAGTDNGFQWAPVDMAWGGSATIEPLASLPIEVWYTNQNLAEGTTSTAQLKITNNTPDQPELEIPLSVKGGGAPTCELLILPNRIDFGLVARGRTVTRELTILNRGTGYCNLTAQEILPLIEIPIPIPGFNEVRFTITRALPLGQIAPSQRIPIGITYAPQAFNADLGTLRLTYRDPYANEEKTAEASLSGLGGESNIEVIPSRVDFGLVTAGECASREERVTVYNTGIVNLCITGVGLEGPDCGEFLITERPRANADGCILVTRNTPADVKLIYQPTNLGPDECNLVFTSDASNTPNLVVPLAGEGTRSRQQTDTFVQTSGQTVDVLFVVDNSGSMSEEQSNLRDSFNAFISGADQFSNDFHIGVITMDMQDSDDSGQLKGSTRIVRRGANAASQFLDNTDNDYLGTRGGGTEQGLAAAEAALSDPLAYDTGVSCTSDSGCVSPDKCIEGFCGGYNRGFLREEAALEIVFVSDEDDQSQGTVNFYVDFLKNLKGYRNEGRMHAHAIVGAENGRASACQGSGGDASRGERYVEVARRTNGGIYSICEEDFGTPLRMIGNQAFGLPVQFFLSRSALESSISVRVDGQERRSGWSYDAESNSIIFDTNQVPQPGQTVEVDYEAQCFARQ